MARSAERPTLLVSTTTLSLSLLTSASRPRCRRRANPQSAEPLERRVLQYIRPTLIGIQPSIGVTASTHAALYVILSHGPVNRRPQRQGTLPTRYERPDTRVARRNGRVQARAK